MHAGGGVPGGSWAEPQVLRMHSKGTCQPTRCQSAKSSTTGNSGEISHPPTPNIGAESQSPSIGMSY